MNNSIPFQLIDSDTHQATELKPEWRLLEASAGTGKTYTLAGLFVRILLEHPQVSPRSILVITFTRAATAELRTRIHQLVHDCMVALKAEDSAAESASATNANANPFVQWVLSRYGNDATALKRLQAAYLELDQTPIQTIHSFCHSILQQFAFATERPFEQEICNEHHDLDLEIAADYWRRYLFTKHVSISSLLMSCSNIDIETLVKLARHCQTHDQYQLENAQFKHKPNALIQTISAQIDSMKSAWPEARAQLLALQEQGNALHASSAYGPKKFEATLANIDSFNQHGIVLDDELLKFQSYSYVASKTLKNFKDQVPSSPYFIMAEELANAAAQLEHSIHHDFLKFFQQELDQRLEQRMLGSHDDIVRWLDKALQEQPQLGSQIGANYQVAFIDECQDTDFTQFRIFRTVFSTKNQHVYLIGDPKQSIYRFRGADIFSYLSARQQVQAQYVLNTNFRSDTAVVAGLNYLFNQGANSFLIEGIHYQSVNSHHPDKLTLNNQPASGLVCWDCANDDNSLSDEERAQGIANEIIRLCAQARIGEKLISPKDIAVLVHNHREGNIIAKRLEAQQIPVVQSGGQNIFATAEASDILSLLLACTKRHQPTLLSNALACPLYAYDNQQLRTEQDAEFALSKPYFYQLMNVWQQHGLLAMFQYFLAHPHSGNTQSPRAYILQSAQGERALVNYLHLIELLHLYATEYQCGPNQVLRYLEQQCADSSQRKDEFEIRLSTDEDAVTILTIHKSKGLEFPIVFVPKANHYKSQSSSFFLDYHEKVEDTWVYKQSYSSKEVKLSAEPEHLSEQLRLFYVAITRAKHRCYIGIDKEERQCLSLLLGQSTSSYEYYQTESAKAEVPLSWETLHIESVELARQKIQPAVHYSLPTPLRLHRSWSITSYSALIRQHEHSAQDHDLHLKPQLQAHDFPKGPKAGNCLHALFEHIPFHQIHDDAIVDPIIAQQLQMHAFDAQYAPAAKHMIRETLLAVPPQLTQHLHALETTAYISELEFFSAQVPLSATTLVSCLKQHSPSHLHTYFDRLSDVNIPLGFLRGFIDLIFFADGRWHILDWKSNLLSDYGRDSMFEEMCSHDYIFQYHVYVLALHRFLRLRLPNYNYDKDLGNVYYAFIRGIESNVESSDSALAKNGWYVERPSAALIHALDALLRELQHA